MTGADEGAGVLRKGSRAGTIPLDVRVAAMRELVNRLRAYRRELGLTQAQVAKMAGVNQSSVSDAERGAANPSAMFLVSYAHAVGVVLVPQPPDGGG
jgi:DNA-binding XRE family transcriptional regulator